jgi:hypothetical protein
VRTRVDYSVFPDGTHHEDAQIVEIPACRRSEETIPIREQLGTGEIALGLIR